MVQPRARGAARRTRAREPHVAFFNGEGGPETAHAVLRLTSTTIRPIPCTPTGDADPRRNSAGSSRFETSGQYTRRAQGHAAGNDEARSIALSRWRAQREHRGNAGIHPGPRRATMLFRECARRVRPRISNCIAGGPGLQMSLDARDIAELRLASIVASADDAIIGKAPSRREPAEERCPRPRRVPGARSDGQTAQPPRPRCSRRCARQRGSRR